eukprot:jgi/Psemu1/221087/e_gw1.1087.6.1
MRLKHLEASLSCLQREFPDPKVELEQYPTSPQLAAHVLDYAVNRGDLGSPGQSCLDLGCGTGMLTVAAAFVVEEDEYVVGVDCDDDALAIAKENVEHVDLEDCLLSLKYTALHCTPLILTIAPTVVTNPPFGTKSDNAGIDVQFLRTATRLARRAVYSFHKKSTRDFLLKTIREDWGFPESEVVAEMRFDIPKSYKFHKSKSKDVEVDLIRIFVGNKNAENGGDKSDGANSVEKCEGEDGDNETDAAGGEGGAIRDESTHEQTTDHTDCDEEKKNNATDTTA